MEIRFRPVVHDDLTRLAAWQAQEHVARWWGPTDLEHLQAEYAPVFRGTEPFEAFIVEVGGEPAGLIQRYLIHDYPEWLEQLPDAQESAGIDYYIGDVERCFRGLGPRVIAAFVDDTMQVYPDADGVIVPVLVDNRPSWRALEKAGFKRLREQFIESADPHDSGAHYVYLYARAAQPPVATVSSPA